MTNVVIIASMQWLLLCAFTRAIFNNRLITSFLFIVITVYHSCHLTGECLMIESSRDSIFSTLGCLPCTSSSDRSCFLLSYTLAAPQCWLGCLINLLLLLLLPLVVSGRHFFSRPPQDQFVRDKGHARVGDHPQQRNGQARVKAGETTVPEPDAPTRRHEANVSPARIHHATADHCDVKVLIDTKNAEWRKGERGEKAFSMHVGGDEISH